MSFPRPWRIHLHACTDSVVIHKSYWLEVGESLLCYGAPGILALQTWQSYPLPLQTRSQRWCSHVIIPTSSLCHLDVNCPLRLSSWNCCSNPGSDLQHGAPPFFSIWLQWSSRVVWVVRDSSCRPYTYYLFTSYTQTYAPNDRKKQSFKKIFLKRLELFTVVLCHTSMVYTCLWPKNSWDRPTWPWLERSRYKWWMDWWIILCTYNSN